jgi:molybdopterin-guanine dinucleotide biosynthesis protein A
MSHTARSAAILAGGRATRFNGRDKSALRVDGCTILDRQVATLASVSADVLVVGDRIEMAPGPARLVRDLVPGCGPLGGLHAALSAARGDALFLIACDMPFVSSPLIEYLFSLAGDADIVVPQNERGYHPLCAVYTRACLEPAAERLADGRLRMRELVESMRTRIVTAPEIGRFGDPDRLLANVNTPADYAALEALQGHKL